MAKKKDIFDIDSSKIVGKAKEIDKAKEVDKKRESEQQTKKSDKYISEKGRKRFTTMIHPKVKLKAIAYAMEKEISVPDLIEKALLEYIK